MNMFEKEKYLIFIYKEVFFSFFFPTCRILQLSPETRGGSPASYRICEEDCSTKNQKSSRRNVLNSQRTLIDVAPRWVWVIRRVPNTNFCYNNLFFPSEWRVDWLGNGQVSYGTKFFVKENTAPLRLSGLADG